MKKIRELFIWLKKLIRSISFFFTEKFLPVWKKFLIPTKKIIWPFLNGFFLLMLCLLLKTFFEPIIQKYCTDHQIVSFFYPRPLFEIAFISMGIIFIFKYFSEKKYQKIKYPTKWYWLILFVWILVRFSSLWNLWHFWELIPPFTLYVDIMLVIFSIVTLTPILLFLKRKKQREDKDYGYFLPDLPIQELAELDKEITGKSKIDLGAFDSLKRGRFANQIAVELMKIKPYKSFAIGINGSWGSGKTSLWQLIKRELNNKAPALPFKLKIIEFSPWLYNNVNSLVSNFFLLLEKENEDFKKDIADYVKKISAVEKTIFNTGFTSLFISSEKTLQAQYNSLAEKFRNNNRLNIIFVDDLDRMDKDEIFGVLRLIKKLADFPNTIYILAYDRAYINSAIKQIITEHESTKYLDKIVQMEFKIPEPNPEDIRISLEERIFTQLKKLKLLDVKKDELKSFFNSDSIDFIIRNERDVKRFSNSVIIRYDTVHPDIDIVTFFFLNLIDYKYPEIYRAIYENKNEIISYFQQHNITQKQKEINSSSPLATILKVVSIDKELEKLIGTIFAKGSNIPIRESIHFHKYFTLELFTGIDFKEFQKSFSLKEQIRNDRFKEWVTNFPEKLLQRLNFIYGNKVISDANDFEKVIDGLFVLREITYEKASNKSSRKSRSQNNLIAPFYKDIFNEINHDNVSRLIDHIITSSTLDNHYKLKSNSKLIDLQCNKFFFFNQRDNSENFNDHFFYKEFDLNEISIKITVTPDEFTDFWRFGFKFSEQNNISEDNRHITGYPLFHLAVGDFRSQTEIGYLGNLYLQRYDEFQKVEPYGGAYYLSRGDYEKESVSIELNRINDETLNITTVFRGTPKNFSTKLDKKFQFFKILAWADRTDFMLKTIIEIKTNAIFQND
jgi:hypothetical protein